MGPNIVEPFHFRVRQLRFLSGPHIAMEFQIHLALLDRSATRSQNLGVDCMDQDWDTHAPQHWHFLFGWSIIIFIRILPHYITLHHITSYYIILHHITMLVETDDPEISSHLSAREAAPPRFQSSRTPLGIR